MDAFFNFKWDFEVLNEHFYFKGALETFEGRMQTGLYGTGI